MEYTRYISLADNMVFPISSEQENFYAEFIHSDDNSAMEKAALLAAKLVFEFEEPETQKQVSELESMKTVAGQSAGTISIQPDNTYLEVSVVNSVYDYLKKVTFFKMPDQKTVYQMKTLMTNSERQEKYKELDPGSDGTVINAYPHWFTGKTKINSANGSLGMIRIGLFEPLPESTTTISFYRETSRPDGAHLVYPSMLKAKQTLQSIFDTTRDTSFRVMSGTYEGDLNMSTSIKLIGSNDLPQEGIAEHPGDAPEETILKGTLKFTGKASEVELRGMTFTGATKIIADGVKSLKIVNCRFKGINTSEEKGMMITTVENKTPTKVNISHCYFEDNTMYHVYEGFGTMANGSFISNNYFKEGACSQNILNIYNVAENAYINIDNNYAEKSDAMVRLGNAGDTKWTLSCDGNGYKKTSDDPKLAGLVGVQPRYKETITFANLTIHIRNTKIDESCVNKNQFAVIVTNKDTVLTPALLPTVYVDDVKQVPEIVYWDLEQTPTCAQGGAAYTTLTEAIAAYKNGGGAIDLFADAEIGDVTIPAGTYMTIRGYGEKRTITGKFTLEAKKIGDVMLSLNNLTLDGASTQKFAIHSENATENIPNTCRVELNDVDIKNYTDKGLYLTNVDDLTIDKVTLTDVATTAMEEPNTRGDYAIDLNLIGVKDVIVSLNQVTFAGDCGKKAAVKIAQRGGASDAGAVDIPKTVGEASVAWVKMTKCAFNNTGCEIDYNVGTTSKTVAEDEQVIENTTGRYQVAISDNTTETVVLLPYISSESKYTIPAGKTAKKTPTGVIIVE